MAESASRQGPRTEAGRDHHAVAHAGEPCLLRRCWTLDSILAIEAEAASPSPPTVELLHWFGSLRENYGGADKEGNHYVGVYGPFRLTGPLYDLWRSLHEGERSDR